LKPARRTGWGGIRTGLAWSAHLANLADLATTLAGFATGDEEVGPFPHWLISHGVLAVAATAVIKGAAALTIWALWALAGRSLATRWGRIAVLTGGGGMAVLAIVFLRAAVINIAVIEGR
jgi:hypothetical protein